MKGQGKLRKEVFLNDKGNKIKQSYAAAEVSYTEEYDNAPLCDMACRKVYDSTKTTCNKWGLIEQMSYSNFSRQLSYDSLARPIWENWRPNPTIRIERQLIYTKDNLLDSIKVSNYQGERFIGSECYCYRYDTSGAQLMSIVHLLGNDGNYEQVGNFTYLYNHAGLIEAIKGKDEFADFTMTVKYYANGKAIR
jgi:hypothetical protein